MKRALLLCGLLIFQPLLIAVEISVGTTRLTIPSPDGYSPITSEMQPYAEIATRFVPPSSEQFALFLPNRDVAVAARGEIPEPQRWFYVQSSKALIQPFVSTAYFVQLKQTIKTQNEGMLKKVESRMPGILQKVNQGISTDYNVDLNLSLDQTLPFPPHYETERGIAYSTLVKYNVNDEDAKLSVRERVVTATLVHIRGKVLFLYANAEKSGLDWCRAESQKWADTVIAANPSTGDIAARESRPSPTGFDWSKVLEKAIAGAIIGGIVGALGYILRKSIKAKLRPNCERGGYTQNPMRDPTTRKEMENTSGTPEGKSGDTLNESSKCPSCGAAINSSDDFCGECGTKVREGVASSAPKLSSDDVNASVERASKWILGVAFMYIIFGTVFGLMEKGKTDDVLAKIAQYEDAMTWTVPVNEKTVTVGELRRMIYFEYYSVFVMNYFLGLVMFGMYYWSKKSPFSAFVTALSVFVGVTVFAAIVDPKSLVQGVIIKVAVVIALVNGIKAAISTRGLKRAGA